MVGDDLPPAIGPSHASLDSKPPHPGGQVLTVPVQRHRMRIDLPPSIVEAGASNEPAGTHTSRTMMFDELDALLDGCARGATYADYSEA